MPTEDEIDKRIDEIRNLDQLKAELKLMWGFIKAGIYSEPKKKWSNGTASLHILERRNRWARREAQGKEHQYLQSILHRAACVLGKEV